MLNSVLTVIIPAYNEEKTIGHVISGTAEVLTALNLPYEIIVVNDGSTDKTLLVASGYKVTVLSNKQNKGKGYCLRKALKFAQGEIIVTLDSDGEHKPKEIPELLSALGEEVDVVSGSRFLGGRSKVTSNLNLLGNLFFNAAIMVLTGRIITDSQTGFRVARRSFLEKLNLESDGFDIETEIAVKSLMMGFGFKELPISIERRKYSISKLKIIRDGTRILSTIVKSAISSFDASQSLIIHGISPKMQVVSQTKETSSSDSFLLENER
jgi:glycosyltransferase involved in cell wall biosynthesis